MEMRSKVVCFLQDQSSKQGENRETDSNSFDRTPVTS